MKAADAGELLALAAIWGGAFLFMRIGAALVLPTAFLVGSRRSRQTRATPGKQLENEIHPR